MSITPETLRRNRKSYAVILQGIIREFKRDEDLFFFLVEGKDAPYYRPRINGNIPNSGNKIEFKNCDGKINVKNLADAIRANSSLVRLQYFLFLDRDYEDDLVQIQYRDAFVTNGYSIENYYTTAAATSAAVRSLFFADAVHTEDDETSVNEIIEAFIILQANVHKEVALFNYWAWAQRHSSRNGKLDLDKFSLKDFIELHFETATARSIYDLATLNTLAPDRKPVTSEEIEAAANWFSTRNTQLHFRGKQEAELLVLFLQWLAERAQKSEAPFKAKRKCSARLSKKEIIAELSPYADTPPNLVSFIDQRKAHFASVRA
ncbi:hypothetical protein ASF69_02330 [Rhizobium sp. Leaf311]|uniref:DUF4435 domain-containing protein n=1 Tax=Rhizobium sp. Leaf311 TaxID=1736332 RepID=UPI000713F460|nr:DUF4435 domain-containing protein [Rhizobium sp. Leaf311]KQQ61264.1 hypothetical protein ASF69_02330 [Rhizobium sp. Leaf311]